MKTMQLIILLASLAFFLHAPRGANNNNECVSAPCMSYQFRSCINSDDSFFCDCSGSGYFGPACQYDPDDFFETDMSGALNIILTAPHSGDTELVDTSPVLNKQDSDDSYYSSGSSETEELKAVVLNRHHGCFNDSSYDCVFEIGCVEQDSEKCRVETTSEHKSDKIVQWLYKEIYKLKSDHPKILINKIFRSQLDVDTTKDKGTFNQELAVIVYDQFHSDMWKGISSFTGPDKRGIVISIHSYDANTAVEWTTLGYRISAALLNENTDSELDGLVSLSSLKLLASNTSLSGLIRGETSLGGKLTSRGLDAVPSPLNPAPGTNTYFDGTDSIILSQYRDFVDVVEVHIHLDASDSGSGLTGHQKKYVSDLAKAIVDFYEEQYATDWCSPNPCLNGGICLDLETEYQCDCAKGYRGPQCEEENRARLKEVTFVLKFAGIFNINLDDFSSYQREEKKLLKQVTKMLRKLLKKSSRLVGIKIKKIWKGSLNVEISVDTEDDSDSIADLTIAITGLGQEIFVVVEQEATASSITMAGLVVNSSPTEAEKCLLYTTVLGGCPGDKICVVENSMPLCKSPSSDKSLLFTNIMVAACVGLVVILSVIILTVVLWRKGKKHGQLIKVVPFDGPMRTKFMREKRSFLRDEC